MSRSPIPMSTTCGGGWFKPLRLWLAVAWLPVMAQAAPPSPHAATLTFNTVCAGCHEGECSGRLSFRSGAESAAGHIRRYAGALTDDEVVALFGQLRRMKEECAFAPLDIPVPQDRVWQGEALQALFSQAGQGYFIPLGTLQAGAYRIELEFGRHADVRLEVLDSHFQFLLERNECAADGKMAAAFTLNGGAQGYARIFVSAPLQVLRLKNGKR